MVFNGRGRAAVNWENTDVIRDTVCDDLALQQKAGSHWVSRGIKAVTPNRDRRSCTSYRFASDPKRVIKGPKLH